MKKTPKEKNQFGTRIRKKRTQTNRPEEATAAYFNSLSAEALEEENRLEAAVASAAAHVNFDADY